VEKAKEKLVSFATFPIFWFVMATTRG